MSRIATSGVAPAFAGAELSATLDRPLEVLLLCDFYPAGTTLEHIHAFEKFSRHRVHTLSNLGDLPNWLDLERFDALIIHYSLVVALDNYISPKARDRIRAFRGFKAVYIQDDYRWIDATVAALAYMRVNALFPLTGPEIMDAVYSPSLLPGVHRETVLTGYVPEELARRPAVGLSSRRLDVGYRARRLPAWLGSHTLQKWQIAERFASDAVRYGLKVDISCREEDRIYGDAWIEFVESCKAMLGTESGASVCDFTGDIQRRVESHVARDPNVSFETLRELYFKEEDGRIMMNVISPRCFEAAALRTLMILYEGHYSGVLVPWRHYVPLARDHGNMDDVVRILRDAQASQEIVDCAYQEIALNPRYTFRAMVHRFDEVLSERFFSLMAASREPYEKRELSWLARPRDADASDFATVESPLQFEPAAPATRLIDNVTSESAAISMPDQPLPHVVELKLSVRIPLRKVRLIWADASALPSRGELVLLNAANVVSSIPLSSDGLSAFQEYLVSTTARIDGIRLEIQEYRTSDRLRLREFRVEATAVAAQELVKRRAKRFRIRYLIMYWLSRIWACLPDQMKVGLRPAGRLVARLLTPAARK